MSKVVVVGAGPAGMAAAIAAAENGHTVTVLEKNEKTGKKLYITGKGRCNLTNACDTQDLFRNINGNAKFLYSAIYGYDNFQVMQFFEETGLKLKTERGNRVFPESDHASDVIAALNRKMRELHVNVCLQTEVLQLCMEKDRVTGLKLKNGDIIEAEAVIVATGGCSYPATGSTGDGYRFAKEAGMAVKPCLPALVPLTTAEEYVKELQGLSLKNVEIHIYNGKKCLYEDFGEMLFTHFGVSGPLILSASSKITDVLQKQTLSMEIDLKPALDDEQLDKRILRQFDQNQNRQFKNAIAKLFPAKLIPVMIEISGIDPEKKVNAVTKEERQKLMEKIRRFPLTLTGTRDFTEAIITKGGVSLKEIDPHTMESKKIKGLFFAGEVLDVDAMTGGFNLQIAWSSGHLAGMSIE
ncbi:MAG: NAD(P)/FAD-dependent oxidoreductase [Lachnospiraceae bacterium]